MKTVQVHTLVLGSGAAGLAAAVRLHAEGVTDVLVLTEGLYCGTSINTGSDKQTYYKLGMYGAEGDSPERLARTYFDGGSMHGDLALVEAALSARCFAHLANLGVPFPRDEYGQFIGYKTDHDPLRRATSCGPYTSREMCRVLMEELERRKIPVVEKRVAVALPVLEEERGRRVCGCIAVPRTGGDFEAYLAENVVFAVGGPGGLYAASVYPAVQTGAIGLALAAGARARNLPESQFGLASVKFRWNVSGTYMQVLPRFISTAADGVSDEREFLLPAFDGDAGRMNSMIFLKGYQWPFDVRKYPDGSSLIDILVHRETTERGRRVFLDFRRNGTGLDFAALQPEAYEYLRRSEALSGTPLERLKRMNPGAVTLYREHGIDLATEPLEVAVCAQHNNGGLAGNLWYESENIRRLFPIGEVNGSHGVCRPGGSALNAGQVGAFRVAEYIAGCCRDATLDRAAAERAASRCCRELQRMLNGKRNWKADRREFRRRMTEYGAQLRDVERLAEAVAAARAQYEAIRREGYPATEAAEGLRNVQLCLAHLVYLEAIAFQAASGCGSRGSALVLDRSGKPIPEDEHFREQVLETVWDGATVVSQWAERRPLPECDGWFETVWRRFREKEIYREAGYEGV